MIYNLFKRNRPLLMSARDAAIAAQKNRENIIQRLMDGIAQRIHDATNAGERQIQHGLYVDPLIGAELTRRLRAQGYIVTESPDHDMIIGWLPVGEEKR